jgi:hypothetical protein
MMSFPVASHIQYRLIEQDGGTLLKFTHQAMGLIMPQHRDGMQEGWGAKLNRIRELAEGKAGKKR